MLEFFFRSLLIFTMIYCLSNKARLKETITKSWFICPGLGYLSKIQKNVLQMLHLINQIPVSPSGHSTKLSLIKLHCTVEY